MGNEKKLELSTSQIFQNVQLQIIQFYINLQFILMFFFFIKYKKERKMATVPPPQKGKPGFEGQLAAEKVHKIRITLTSRNVKNLEKGKKKKKMQFFLQFIFIIIQ